MKKKEEPKAPKPTKVWYIVESTSDISETNAELSMSRPSLKEAYEEEIACNGTSAKKYLYKIELVGEVKNELKIVK